MTPAKAVPMIEPAQTPPRAGDARLTQLIDRYFRWDDGAVLQHAGPCTFWKAGPKATFVDCDCHVRTIWAAVAAVPLTPETKASYEEAHRELDRLFDGREAQQTLAERIRRLIAPPSASAPASDVARMRQRVWNYINNDYDDDDSYAVDIMEDFLKMLGSSLPRNDSDVLPAPPPPAQEPTQPVSRQHYYKDCPEVRGTGECDCEQKDLDDRWDAENPKF